MCKNNETCIKTTISVRIKLYFSLKNLDNTLLKVLHVELC